MTTDPAASGPAAHADGHVDPDRLADLAEGLLDGAGANAVRDHLASCERCADDFALITLDSGLAGFLTPEPIPAEVVARVEAALHREPPLRDPSVAAASSQQHVHRATRPTRVRRFKLAFGALASVGLLAGGVVVGVSMVGGGGNDSTASKAVSGAAGTSESRFQGNAPAAAAPALLAQIQQEATSLLASGKGAAGSTAASASGRPDSALRTPSGAAAGCWQNLRPSAKLLASAATTYQGQPAELLVYDKPGDADHADVLVVSTACPTSAQSTPAPGTPQLPLSADGTPLPHTDSAFSAVVLAETSITRP